MIKEIFSAQHDRDKIIFNCSFDILKMLLVFLDQIFVMSILITTQYRRPCIWSPQIEVFHYDCPRKSEANIGENRSIIKIVADKLAFYSVNNALIVKYSASWAEIRRVIVYSLRLIERFVS